MLVGFNIALIHASKVLHVIPTTLNNADVVLLLFWGFFDMQ